MVNKSYSKTIFPAALEPYA